MDLKKKYVYRITHIKNIPHILEFGITHKDSANSNPNYTTIGDASLISTRNTKLTPFGDLIGSYIPFYFCYKSPMLFVIQKGYNYVPIQRATNIVYCVTTLYELIESKIPFIYTDGHATDSYSSFYTVKDVEKIDKQLDFNAIKAKFWIDEKDLDLKRRKEAELLLKSDLPVKRILGYIVNSNHVKDELINLGISKKIIVVKPEYYFEQ